MNEGNYKIINELGEKINSLISLCEERKEKNKALKKENEDLKEQLQSQKQEKQELQEKYENLKISKTLTKDSNPEEMKSRIDKLVQEIDKCIALLNE